MWIGLEAVGNNITGIGDYEWLWPDTSSFSQQFSNWEKFNPLITGDPQSGKCVTINSQTLLWTNRRCYSFYPFLCEQKLRCPIDWLQIGERCYLPSSTSYNSWSNAFAYCMDLNASLAIVHDQSEYEFVKSLALSTDKSMWIALKSNMSGLQWISEDQYQLHQHPNAKDICMVANVSNGIIYWQLQKCLNIHYLYPLCMRGATSPDGTNIISNKQTDAILNSIGTKQFRLCSNNWLLYERYCFRLKGTKIKNSLSENYCQDTLASYPAIILDQTLETMITSMLSDGDEAWIGLQYKSGFFSWFDNKTMLNYSNWAKGEPRLLNESRCVTLQRHNESKSYWYTRNCEEKYAYICQRLGKTFECPKSWLMNDSSCIKIFYAKLSFHEARELCRIHRSDLVILSPEIRSFVENLIPYEMKIRFRSISYTNQSFWIGLYKKSSEVYMWIQSRSLDHLVVTKLKANSSETTHRCVIMKYMKETESWEWYPANCFHYKAYPICRKTLIITETESTTPSPAPSDSTVAFISSAESLSTSSLASNLISNQTLSSIHQNDFTEKINYIELVEKTGLQLAQNLPTNSSMVQSSYHDEALGVYYVLVNALKSNGSQITDIKLEKQTLRLLSTYYGYPLRVRIPLIVVPTEPSERYQVALGIYKTTPIQIESSKLPLMQHSISCNIKPLIMGRFPDPVIFYFKITLNTTIQPLCAYWKEKHWATDGVETQQVNSTIVKCIAYHLTSFSVLLQTDSYKKLLSILTYVGLSTSLFCLILTLLTFTIVRRFYSIRGVVHANLAASLIISTSVYIAGIQKTDNEVLCQIIAVVLHFSFLASFSWMLVEGIVTFKMSIHWTEKMASCIIYVIIGWGTPFIIVLVAFLLRKEFYGTSNYCWIAPGNFLLFAFGIPGLVTIGINLIFMILITRTLMGIRAMANKSKIQKTRVSLRASIALLPLLGITWIFGYVAIQNKTVVFSYIFVILNSLQGTFVFYFHCLKYKGVKKFYKSCIIKCRNVFATTQTSSSIGIQGSRAHINIALSEDENLVYIIAKLKMH
ncbi:uncharacterized protein TRIADDRAFT_59345 [Trichoplax adhaerens]|uniref:Adhesion G protein-coupled receptor L3 n=1 Tax=Trichoplax adhaerens TaxID=10228 RepID=B3S4U0_TRIAD|nr:hypothetical protein TRIADDRAFT_59345 [Trichoplax adhaerens]EDV22271.1 hypothetical protein TRIADDRAFT_59345 [Trichoplax adhaerens]|eukprot:XP_002115426.1 hypothetical protein TRIADDRAFT_59345 [Trichoplax adhaerens]